ncbi:MULTISPECIES: hypothetical protein [unclassified Pseudoclavibacter]|uniref:hypothetical protein n=1 Tax=unclassified Pseudoclavibacter TaxID=2615177 RepID=UPI000CE85BD5|nr:MULTISPECIES: hypothetical protein [unclassified Pseudoclavibacter]MBS3178684.1 hypothetical protein [Pseudoclavibacter sp. Marseille-Q4354]PPG27629.1 hypothetical protein C5B97_15770 [Pseudoclavibacter sp. RFBB5]
MSILVTVNREQFVLRDPEAITRVRAEIEEAARSGGRMLVIGDSADGPEVLVTPSTNVRIDILPLEAPDEGESDDRDEVAFVDFDEY